MPLLMCPNCHEGMKEISREGVQIDLCPTCRGVWLDRGELEKLLEVNRREISEYESAPPPSSRQVPPQSYPPQSQGYAAPPPPQYPPQNYPPQHNYDHQRGHSSHGYHQKPYKKKSKLEAMFDIFD